MNVRAQPILGLAGKAIRKGTLLATSTWWCYRLKRIGVELGSNVTIIGRPIVSVYPGSTVTIGSNVVLCSDSRSTALGVSKPVTIRTLAKGATISIGNDVGMSGTVICAAKAVRIGTACLFGADVTVADTNFHPIAPSMGRRYAPIPKSEETDAIEIGNDVFLGAGSHILKGVAIGDGSVVGAKSLVTRSVPEGSIVAGNPAAIIGSVGDTR
ncbi:DapH/DapD/GlmU-related protein [Rhodococcus sp. F64268]|uniref:acyltransferase n=1 Tax=Rhodococcus sp. F64268 TaxID=2926402 RepID=UPI0035B37690